MKKPRPSLIIQRPVDTARELLGECLGKLQDITHPGVNVKGLVEKAAQTVRTLFEVGKYDPMENEHVEGIKSAIELIGQSLAMLQDTGSKEAAVFDASQIMARVLSILYPISKAQEMQAPPSPPAKKEVAPHPRRTATRIGLNADIGIQSENNFYTGFSEDISEGGIFITTYDSKPLGTKMNLTFTLPNGYVVMAKGAVKWLREFNQMTPEMKPGMGIQFDELSPEDKTQIDMYIKTEGTMFYDGD